MNTLAVLTWLCAFVVLAEGLNKLHRADLFDGQLGWRPRVLGLLRLLMPWGWKRSRAVLVIKVVAWALICVGVGGYLVRPFLPPPLFDPAGAVIAGFALLIVRSRLKEGSPP